MIKVKEAAMIMLRGAVVGLTVSGLLAVIILAGVAMAPASP